MLSVAVRQVLSFAGVAVLARKLGPEAYGLMGMAALVTVFLINFRDLGTAAAVIQRPQVTSSMLSSLFWVNVMFGSLLTLLVVGASEPVAIFFKDPRVGPVLRWLSISFLLTSSGVIHQALLSREIAFHYIAWAELASSAAGYLVAIPMADRGFGVWSLVAANVLNSLVSTILFWVFCPWRPRWEFNTAEIRSISKFSLNLGGFGFVNYFSRNADNVIIGRVLGSEPLGYYQMAYNLMLYPLQNISAVISQVLFPAFARIQDNDERFRSAYIRSCLLIALATFPIMGGMAAVADPLVRALLGEKWVPAVLIIQILAPVGLVQSVYTTTGQIFTSKGRTDWMFRWGFVTCLILVSGFFLGIRYGIAGVATVYGISYLVIIVPIGFFIPFRLIGLRMSDFLRPFVPQFLITVLMAMICVVWLHLLDRMQVSQPWPRLISSVAVGMLIYVLAMLWVYPPGLQYLLDDVIHPSPHAMVRKVGGIVESISRRLRSRPAHSAT